MRRVGALRAATLALGLCFCAPTPAAAHAPARERTWFGTIFVGQWFSLSEPDAGQQIGSRNAGFQDSHFASVLLSRVIVPRLDTGWRFIGPLIDGGSIELEAQAGRHFGLQDHGEVTLALLWRSRELRLSAGSTVNLAVGEGFSHALSRPAYEGTAKGQDPVRFLNYLAFEAEFSHDALGAVSIVPRIHHRSGIFGVIAPRGSGSDFIGVGLRITLR